MALKATCYNCGRRGQLRAMCCRDRRKCAVAVAVTVPAVPFYSHYAVAVSAVCAITATVASLLQCAGSSCAGRGECQLVKAVAAKM